MTMSDEEPGLEYIAVGIICFIAGVIFAVVTF